MERLRQFGDHSGHRPGAKAYLGHQRPSLPVDPDPDTAAVVVVREPDSG
ncbi:MAG: hypothetical protein ACRDUA_13415 [Micromonosporaceae bacterium]